MTALQTTIKSILGLMIGMAAGAIVGGVLGMVGAGPIGVISGMILGAMVGATIGTGASLWRSVESLKAAPQVAYSHGQSQGRRVQVAMGGD